MPAAESVAQVVDTAEAEELKNDLRRLQAEYVNYRKRVERDRAVAGEMAVIGVLNSLLPVLDDVDAARQHGDLTDGPVRRDRRQARDRTQDVRTGAHR